MKTETAEWLAKAEGDLRTAQRELLVTELPNYDAVCFHSQQCAEKYLKSLLVEHGRRVPYIHDLEALVVDVCRVYSGVETVISSARILTAMAVEVRYPGMSADMEDAEEAIRAALLIRDVCLKILES